MSSPRHARSHIVRRVLFAAARVTALLTCACAEPTAPRERLDLSRGVEARVSAGWRTAPANVGLALVPEDSSGPASKIELSVAPRDEYDVHRTATVAMQGVVTQAQAMRDAAVQRVHKARAGSFPAATLDWSYTRDGRTVTRRHWAIELRGAIVHVSCSTETTAIPAACAEVAASIKEANRGS